MFKVIYFEKISFCPDVVTLSDGNWGSWTAFAACSVTCGGGTQMRTRNCDSPAPSNGGIACAGLANESQTCNNATCPVSKYYTAF
jgi:hypothetical protein